MTAYYNEFDPRASAWLLELIAEGLIAPGDVDERSIVDVQGSDLEGYDQCHFFAGIGGWSYALRLDGWPDDVPVWTGSCPCQGLSVAGKGLGAEDGRHLWPEFRRLISECRPSTIFGEQVASQLGLGWLAGVRADLEDAGYAVGAADLPAAGISAPHARQRIFWVANSERSRLPRRVKNRPVPVATSEARSVRNDAMAGTWRGLARSDPALPLVDGLSVAATRRLIAPLGNAIVPEVAAAFIRAYVDATT